MNSAASNTKLKSEEKINEQDNLTVNDGKRYSMSMFTITAIGKRYLPVGHRVDPCTSIPMWVRFRSAAYLVSLRDTVRSESVRRFAMLAGHVFSVHSVENSFIHSSASAQEVLFIISTLIHSLSIHFTHWTMDDVLRSTEHAAGRPRSAEHAAGAPYSSQRTCPVRYERWAVPAPCTFGDVPTVR